MAPVQVTINRVVVRFLDHRLAKGTTEDFHPDKPEFHLQVGGAQAHTATIPIRDLKAVFFVRTYEGNRRHAPADDLNLAKGQGRKIEVVFKDGETLRGFTVGYNKMKQGFFVIPADSEGNNQRVFVINAAVRDIRWR